MAKLTDASAAHCCSLYTDTPQHNPQLTLAAAARRTQSNLTAVRAATQHRAPPSAETPQHFSCHRTYAEANFNKHFLLKDWFVCS